MFGRRKDEVREVTEADVDEFVDDLDPQDRALEDAELERELEAAERQERAPLRPQGPWDEADAPERERLDLGALQVAVPDAMELQLQVGPDGQVGDVILLAGDSTAQLNVFAAPRSEGIWDEVRQEIADALSSGGGRASEGQGVLGTELRAVVPQEVPGQGVVHAPARFLGVDGPRWFLRALLTGPAATDDEAAQPLLEVVRDIVVVRGTDPMPAREPLALALPPQAQQVDPASDGGSDAGPDGAPPTLSLPERGPEITEIR